MTGMPGMSRTLAGLGGTAVMRTAALLAGVLVAGAATGVSFAAQDVALSMNAPADSPLRIEGSIAGVRPGASATLTLTLRNGSDEAHPVTRVRADVTGVASGAKHCDGGFLNAGEWHGDVAVPARGTSTVTLPVDLAANLPADCATAVWSLLYTAY